MGHKCHHIFRETTASKPTASPKKGRDRSYDTVAIGQDGTEVSTEVQPPHDINYIAPSHGRTQVTNFIRERDHGCQQGVGGVLDHFSRLVVGSYLLHTLKDTIQLL